MTVSVTEHLFFDPGPTSTDAAGRAMAGVLESEMIERKDRRLLVLPSDDDVSLSAVLEENDYVADDPDPSEPTDRSVFDDLPMVLRMNLVPTTDLDAQASAARAVFDRLASSDLGWPLVLVHEFELLVATYDLERGVREFPPGTRSDGTDEDLWR